MKAWVIILPFFLLWATAGFAQQTISISDEDIALLGIEFAPLAKAQYGAGITLPAQVVSSPDAFTEITSRFGGVIEQWHVQPGDKVERGDVLASVRSPQVLTLQQEYLAQRNRVALDNERLNRDARLLQQGIISEQRFQQTESTARLAEMALDALVMELQLAGITADELTGSQSGDHELGLQLLRAPRDGLLMHRAFSVGQYVEGNELIATLNEPGNPWLSIQVPARLAAFLEIGSKLTVSGSGATLTLRQRDFEIDTGTQTLEVLAQYDQPVNEVPGQLRNVELHPSPDSLFVPATAVVFEGDDAIVYLRSGNGVEVRTPQLVPAGTGYLAESGLRPGELILVKGAALVKGMQLGLGSSE